VQERSDPGGGSPGLHKPGIKDVFLEKMPGAEGWGNPVQALVRARAKPLANLQKKLPSAFLAKGIVTRMGRDSEGGSVSAEAKREAE
jgi:hypothetical protein